MLTMMTTMYMFGYNEKMLCKKCNISECWYFVQEIKNFIESCYCARYKMQTERMKYHMSLLPHAQNKVRTNNSILLTQTACCKKH